MANILSGARGLRTIDGDSQVKKNVAESGEKKRKRQKKRDNTREADDGRAILPAVPESVGATSDRWWRPFNPICAHLRSLRKICKKKRNREIIHQSSDLGEDHDGRNENGGTNSLRVWEKGPDETSIEISNIFFFKTSDTSVKDLQIRLSTRFFFLGWNFKLVSRKKIS